VFSREICTANFPQRFRQPTTIVKYNRETDPRVWLNDYRLACQLGGATSDEVIIRNLPLHLADSARTWLEHLPASQIHNWDDLVRTFVGNFWGTFALGTPGTCALAPRSPASHPGTSYGASPSVVRSSQAWHSPKSCTPSSKAPRAGILCASSGAARRLTRTSCSTSPPALPRAKRRWGRSSTARRASAQTMSPRRAASPRSSDKRTSGARRERSRAARRASRGTTTTTAELLLLTRLDGALDQPLEARGFSTTC
jgi:hypothetical protein